MDDRKLPLKPMRRVLVSDEIIDQIKNLILDGTLQPGDQLGSETKLASQMDVGRSTIREALKVLIHLGFIERKNRVAIVSDRVRSGINPQQIVDRFKKNRNFLEMIEVRKIIEPDIAAMAATRCDAGDLELISEDVEAMRQSLGKLDAFLDHDYHFHLHLAQASGNQILTKNWSRAPAGKNCEPITGINVRLPTNASPTTPSTTPLRRKLRCMSRS